jgi:hypothetical protein
MTAAPFRPMTGRSHKETDRMTSRRASRRIALAICSIVALMLGIASTASAAPAPHWHIFAWASPTYFHPGDDLAIYEVRATNDGSAPTDGPITIVDELPSGVTAIQATGVAGIQNTAHTAGTPMACLITGPRVECTTEANVPIGRPIAIKINVEVSPGAVGPLRDTASILGGGALEEASTTISTPVVSSSTPVPFGAKISVEATTADGTVAGLAGSHPYSLLTTLAVNVANLALNESCPTLGSRPIGGSPGCAVMVGAAKDIEVSLPPGLVGNPQELPKCTQAAFLSRPNGACPADTQVGVVFNSFFSGTAPEQFAPVYNIEPPPGQPAEFGFTVGGQVQVPMFFHVRADGDYGLVAKLSELPTFDAVKFSELTIWGMPAARSHDLSRETRIIAGCNKEGCQLPAAPARPLLSMPTSCAPAPLPVPLRTDSWVSAGQFAAGDPEATIPQMGGCNHVPFDPTLEARPTTNVADSPTGLHVDLHVPQPVPSNEPIREAEKPGETGAEKEAREQRELEREEQGMAGLVQANLKDAVVTLPKGITVNPSSANGLTGCLPDQIALHVDAPAACPDSAKIGRVEVDTPLLDHPLPGSVYLAQPFDNPFNSLLAIYLAVFDPQTNVVVKLAGHVELGDEGQLTTTFAENPQLPFEDFKLDFFEGPRAPLKTPAVCGSYRTTSSLTPWSAPESGPPASTAESFPISGSPVGGACPTSAGQQPNSPAFEAGMESVLAGAYSPFVLHLKREDGSQQFSSLNIDMPPGLLGKLAGISYCPESDLAAAAGKSGAEEKASASCPASSEVGTVNVGAGAGISPYHVEGRAYLAGPYKGAPLSLAIVTPAVAGPFDLGTVVVRSALEVNPTTSQITVKSDPIPTELMGIPLDVRSIAVKIGRPDFTLNPTNCEPLAIGGSETSTVGNTATLHNGFQVGGCDQLAFKPKLKLQLKGASGRLGHPALKAVLTYPQGPGYANIARAQVNLPHTEFLDQGNLNKTCTKPVLLAGNCPKSTIYGKARAWTPLLEKPLEGNVYLVGGYGYKLPALVADLNGQIRVTLAGKVDSGKNKGIRNTFELVPDAPVSRFELSMKGGTKYGLLENSENLCKVKKAKRRAVVRFTAQNGKVKQWKPVVTNKCGKKKKAKKHAKGKKHKRGTQGSAKKG